MNWKKFHYYLYTFCRYFLATMIISYAFAKILETQFVSQPSIYDRPIGSLNGFQLTWFYFGYSYWYGLVIAFTQIISAFLLFYRKTVRIGIILFLTFMVNITLMDFAYDIKEAKIMALILTGMALFVLLSDYKLLIKYFLQEPPLFATIEQSKWQKKARFLKFIYIPIVFIGLFLLLTTMKKKYMGQNKFYGTWENTVNADRLHFEAGDSFQLIRNNENKSFKSGIYTFTQDSLKLKIVADDKIFAPKNSALDDSNFNYYLKGIYQLNDKNLRFQTEHDTLTFKRIR